MPLGSASRPLVAVVDDDLSMREFLPHLLREFGFDAEAYESPQEFLRSASVERTDCLLLDIAMPGMSGLDLQDVLSHRKRAIPIVFITGEPDLGVRARVLAAGAVECLFKPFPESALLRALTAALAASQR
jgi:FixJ family two-component response regulator